MKGVPAFLLHLAVGPYFFKCDFVLLENDLHRDG